MLCHAGDAGKFMYTIYHNIIGCLGVQEGSGGGVVAKKIIQVEFCRSRA